LAFVFIKFFIFFEFLLRLPYSKQWEEYQLLRCIFKNDGLENLETTLLIEVYECLTHADIQ